MVENKKAGREKQFERATNLTSHTYNALFLATGQLDASFPDQGIVTSRPLQNKIVGVGLETDGLDLFLCHFAIYSVADIFTNRQTKHLWFLLNGANVRTLHDKSTSLEW